ncbi:hypothetical protein [Enterococcus sp. AZ189]|uniref:hypothetical protein n=1 Tax=Enterococcus sp. AZ189 TaxID=2774871 RepID=UPI003F683244
MVKLFDKLFSKEYGVEDLFIPVNDFDFYEHLNRCDVSYELSGEVPKLYIKGKEVGVVSMTMHYVTAGTGLGTKTITFIYLMKGNPEHKVISINNLGEVFDQ